MKNKPIWLKNSLVKRGRLFSAPQILTCLEISEEHIKLAQFEATPEGKKLVYLFTRKIPSLDERIVIKTLEAVLAELKFRGRILSCLPRHQVTVRYLKLPSANPRELEAMLDFQVTKQIPYPKEETVYSYSILGVDASGYADILLAIVHREAISQHLRLLGACNLEPERVSFNALSSCEWFIYDNPAISEAVLFIDIDTTYTNISVISMKGLCFTRAIKLEVKGIESEGNISALNHLKEEVRLSLSAFGKEAPDIKINKFVLTGATSVLDKVKEILENEFKFEIEIRLAMEKVKLKKDVLEENWFDPHRVSLSAVLGLGLEQDSPSKLNLLPVAIKEERLKRQKHYQVVFSFILAGLIFATGLGFLTKKFHGKASKVSYLNQQVQKISGSAEGLEEKKRHLELVEGLFANRGISLDIILELHKIIPSEINLVSLDFENKKGLTLRGTSRIMAEVFRLVTILDKSSFFTNSQVRFVKKRVGAGDLTDFEIYCPIRGEGEREK